MLITPNDIRSKAERLYPRYLAAMVGGEDFFPCELPFRKVKATDGFDVIRGSVDALLASSRSAKGKGYDVTLSPVNTRRYGVQHYPARIAFETEADYLVFLGKHEEVAQLRVDLDLIRREMPRLEEWSRRNVRQVIAYAGRWSDLLAVCKYFIDNSRPRLYARQLPLELHTKFVEAHQGILRELLDELLPADAIYPDAKRFEERYHLRYDEPLVRFRVLDPELQTRLGLPVMDLSVPVSEAETLPFAGASCVVTENKMTFLTLPPLRNCIGILGAGFGAELLGRLSWLDGCRLLYWGDIDAHGFEILSMIRGRFPQVESVMMDRVTLDCHRTYVVDGTPAASRYLPHLTAIEESLYAYVREENIRIEQEKISHRYAAQVFAAVGCDG